MFGISNWDIFWFVVGLVVSSPILVYVLAKNNIIFTFVDEGTVKAILRFGKFYRMVMNYKGYCFDEEWNVVEGEGVVNWWERLEKRLWGLKIVGIPLVHRDHTYNFRWTSFEQVKEKESGKTKDEPVTKSKRIDCVLVRDDVYFTIVEAAETQDIVPVNMSLLLTLRVINPYRALFRVQHWLEATQNRIKPAFRRFVSEFPFEILITKVKAGKKELEEEEKKFSFMEKSGVDDRIKEEYGVLFVPGTVEIVTVDPVDPEHVKAAAAPWVADREAKAVVKKAEAEKQAKKLVLEGIAEGYKVIGEKTQEGGGSPNVAIQATAFVQQGKLLVAGSSGALINVLPEGQQQGGGQS